MRDLTGVDVATDVAEEVRREFETNLSFLFGIDTSRPIDALGC